VLEPDDAAEAVPLIKVEPAIDGVWVARLEEAGAGHGMRCWAISNFE
jgi:hypothetical protein